MVRVAQLPVTKLGKLDLNLFIVLRLRPSAFWYASTLVRLRYCLTLSNIEICIFTQRQYSGFKCHPLTTSTVFLPFADAATAAVRRPGRMLGPLHRRVGHHHIRVPGARRSARDPHVREVLWLLQEAARLAASQG